MLAQPEMGYTKVPHGAMTLVETLNIGITAKAERSLVRQHGLGLMQMLQAQLISRCQQTHGALHQCVLPVLRQFAGHSKQEFLGQR
jgi:hypothetical protein